MKEKNCEHARTRFLSSRTIENTVLFMNFFLNCEIMKDDHAIILNKQKLIHKIFRILILFPSKKFDKRFITNHITESVLSTV